MVRDRINNAKVLIVDRREGKDSIDRYYRFYNPYHKVTKVSGTGEALDLLAKEEYDLVLMDIGIPKESKNPYLLSEINERGIGVPIIFTYSAYDRKEANKSDDEIEEHINQVRSVIKAGASGYVINRQGRYPSPESLNDLVEKTLLFKQGASYQNNGKNTLLLAASNRKAIQEYKNLYVQKGYNIIIADTPISALHKLRTNSICALITDGGFINQEIPFFNDKISLNDLIRNTYINLHIEEDDFSNSSTRNFTRFIIDRIQSNENDRIVNSFCQTSLFTGICGPKGSGKSTLESGLASVYPHLTPYVKMKSRTPRPGELNGKDYILASKEDIRKLASLPNHLKFSNWYEEACVDYDSIRESLESANGVIITIPNIAVLEEMRSLYSEMAIVNVLPKSSKDLLDRLEKRDMTLQKRHEIEREYYHFYNLTDEYPTVINTHFQNLQEYMLDKEINLTLLIQKAAQMIRASNTQEQF